MSAKRREKAIYRITLVGAVADLLLVVFKLIAGILGRSTAMIADAVHSLSDLLIDIIVLVFVKLSGKPQDANHAYGHGKFETLSTAIIGMVLVLVGLGILWEGGVKIWDALHGVTLDSPGMIAFWACIVAIVMKELLYRRTKLVARKVKSDVLVANAWHHRSDVFSSVGTALGIGGAIFLGEKFRVLDPIAAVVVSIFIIKIAVQLLKPAMDELLEKSLCSETEAEILTIISQFPEIKDPHNLRTRKIGNTVAIDVHVRMDNDLTVKQSHDITLRMEQALRQRFGVQTFIYIHVEPLH